MPVYFRKSPDIVALFPTEYVDVDDEYIAIYRHGGSYGAALPELMDELEPALPDEYADLLVELEGIYGPENLTVIG